MMEPDGKINLERRCPRLGGSVTFGYCLQVGRQQQPCWKTVDCWWEFFDVVGYLKTVLTEEELTRLIHAKPKPKITSILELIEKAKERSQT